MKLLQFMTSRLALLCDADLGRIGRLFKSLLVDKSFMTAGAAKLPFSTGLVLLVACWELQVDVTGSGSQWISENSAVATPLVIRAFSQTIKTCPVDCLKSLLVPVLNRLLLRASGSALGILMNLNLSEEILLSDLLDGIWAQLASDNDENRTKAGLVLAQVNTVQPIALKIETTIAGKSIKAKKAFFILLHKLLLKDSTNVEPILRRILAKETNEEVVYWIVSCLFVCNCNGNCNNSEAKLNLVGEGLKQNKAALRSSFIAAACDHLPAEKCKELLTKQDIDQLVVLLATMDTVKPSASVLKAGLAPTGFISLASECLGRYPLLPIWKLVNLFSIISEDADACRLLWKVIIGLYAQNSELTIQFNVALQKMSPPLKYIEEGCHGYNPTILSNLLLHAANSETSLVELAELAHRPSFKETGLWNNLVRRMRCKKLDGISDSLVQDKLLTVQNLEVLEAIITVFPQVANSFASHLVEFVKTLSSINPTEEDIVIINTPRHELPVIDGKQKCSSINAVVVTPIRKALEAAAKKDPTKKPPATGLSKAEKTALDAEIAREEEIIRKHLDCKQKLRHLTMVIKAFANVNPRLLEPFLGQIAENIYCIGGWIETDISKCYYQLARCCSPPLGKYGPLLGSVRYSLQNAALIDPDWNVPLRTDLNSALVRHLNGDRLAESSWNFVFPAIVALLQSVPEEVDDLTVASLLAIVATNSEMGVSWRILSELFTVCRHISGMMPGVFAAVNTTITTVVNHARISASDVDVSIFVHMLQSPSDLERRFGLSLTECMAGRFRDILVASPVLKLWVSILCCDANASIKALRLAEVLYGGEVPIQEWKELVKIAVDVELDVATSASNALIKSLVAVPAAEVFSFLEATYRHLFSGRIPEMAHIRAPKLDLTAVSRERLALVYLSLAKALDEGVVLKSAYYGVIPKVIQFFLLEAFFDPREKVQDELLNAAGCLVSAGLEDKTTVDAIAHVCDLFLSAKGKSDEDYDRVRVYGVILLAKVAERFPSDDPRRGKLLESLYATLSTPSENVQNAVADAMVSLFPLVTAEMAVEYLERFLKALSGPSMAVRRGSAYGLGALIKGRGSRMLNEHSVLNRLGTTLQEKSATVEAKQGALFGLELVARYMGRSFEPYIVKLLDVLMATFADGRTEVREASLEAAQTIMSTVSSLGARLLLPVLLEQMASTSWRSKVGAIEWLGAMASLAPRVLAKQLPLILPKLVDSLTDSHHQVQRAAREALYRYGGVVRSPEIRALSSIIMEALANPPEATEKCLHSILHTAFAHVIDGPSLALLEPVLVRALRDRGTEIKKRAAQIVGNLATNLVDPRDLEGVLTGLVPALLSCLSDPVPEVRAHCGKVLGILVKTVGERPTAIKSLAENLFSIISSPHATSVDRAGAAQALAEILAARGASNIVELLEDAVMAGLLSNRTTSREGFIMLVGYLPAAFNTELPELYEIGLRALIGPSLGLLADENEAVREAANTACHSIIDGCARIDHVAIFDVLVETLSDVRWRCRLGCLQLFMEFLSKFSAGESDVAMGIFSMPSQEELMAGGIDEDRIRGLMSRSFLYRFDINSSAIRHHALTIWKGLASHPLRAISSILPVFIEECCGGGMTENEEGRDVIYKALEDMLSKIGDRLLAELLDRCTVLAAIEDDSKNESDVSANRVGALFVATVAAQILGNGVFPGVTNNLLDTCIPKFIGILQIGLNSIDDPSRSQACRLFIALVESPHNVGVVDRIVEPMLEELLGDPVVDPVTLDGLVDLLKSDETDQVFNTTIKALLAPDTPLKDAELALAVCEVVAAVFDAIGAEGASKTVPILRTIIQAGVVSVDSDIFRSTCFSILAALEADYDSSYQVSLSQLLESTFSSNPSTAFAIISIYCGIPDASLVRFYDIWPRRMLDCSSQSEMAALEALVGSVSIEGVHSLAMSINDALDANTKIEEKELVKLMVKNLIVPLLTQNTGVGFDDEDCRNLACRLCIRLSTSVDSSAWGSALTSLVGALIRTASDKRTTSSRVFEALAACVVSQSKLVRPFHPQLQRIFSNALAIETVRSIGIGALVALLPVLSRPDALLNDLLVMAESGPTELRLAALEVLHATNSCGEPSRVVEVAQACLADDNGVVREAGSKWIKLILPMGELEPHRSSLQSLLTHCV
ncbi:putative tanslational activator GCN1 [Paramicrosporidium saccamoebae]|uniref:Putative tanslational activator GCN1 n=1 Tax=Paramicrosporidium saccamoebae TaxID=1246581 RepID=A0A2H9TLZ9_9FUNG|nr:putative tanslational activator GCN1 [Paramicrosporidium saccamoebae]